MTAPRQIIIDLNWRQGGKIATDIMYVLGGLGAEPVWDGVIHHGWPVEAEASHDQLWWSPCYPRVKHESLK